MKMIKNIKQWIKVQFYHHDWEPFGVGFGCFDGVVYNQVCLSCKNEWLLADEMKARSEALAKMIWDDRKARVERKKQRKERLQELGYESQ